MDIAKLKKQIDSLPEAEKLSAFNLLLEIEDRKSKDAARENFIPFVRRIWPEFISGQHHKIMGEAFDRVAKGDLKRLIINMPPRHTKSMFGSYLFPAWYLGQYPNRKIIQASHTGELAVEFGRQVRNLINSTEFHEVFENVTIAADSKAAGRWNTNRNGSYFAVGVGGTMTGRGADILVVDDPHSEQDATQGQFDRGVYDKAYEWYTSGPRQRLQPGGSIVIIATRWSKIDLTGQILQHSAKSGGDEWEVIELPAIMPSGEALWPEFWRLTELESIKNDIPITKWEAQYQQKPTSEEGALIKREWWKVWERPTLPKLEAIIQSWDTAFTKTHRSNYSACTTWGVFMHPDKTGRTRPNLILMDAMKDKLEFPELKQEVLRQYREWEPDQLVVEKRASGAPLIFELRAMGVPVTEYTPSRGNDKITRVNAITDIFASGMVWRRDAAYADEVIEECAAFPQGDHDDYVDSTSQALLRFRQGGWLHVASDEEEEDLPPRQPVDYY